MRLDGRTLIWLAVSAVAGWLLHAQFSGFSTIAFGLALTGFIVTIGSESLFLAPIGLLAGALTALAMLPTGFNFLSVAATVASMSIAVLAGMLARLLKRNDSSDGA